MTYKLIASTTKKRPIVYNTVTKCVICFAEFSPTSGPVFNITINKPSSDLVIKVEFCKSDWEDILSNLNLLNINPENPFAGFQTPLNTAVEVGPDGIQPLNFGPPLKKKIKITELTPVCTQDFNFITLALNALLFLKLLSDLSGSTDHASDIKQKQGSLYSLLETSTASQHLPINEELASLRALQKIFKVPDVEGYASQHPTTQLIAILLSSVILMTQVFLTSSYFNQVRTFELETDMVNPPHKEISGISEDQLPHVRGLIDLYERVAPDKISIGLQNSLQENPLFNKNPDAIGSALTYAKSRCEIPWEVRFSPTRSIALLVIQGIVALVMYQAQAWVTGNQADEINHYENVYKELNRYLTENDFPWKELFLAPINESLTAINDEQQNEEFLLSKGLSLSIATMMIVLCFALFDSEKGPL